MYTVRPRAALSLWFLLLQPALAQRNSSDASFEAPPLQKASLAFFCIFSILGLGQLSIAVSFLFRTQSPHFPAGLVGVIAIIFLILSNGINIASTVARYTYDSAHHRQLSNKNIFDFQAGGALFNDWVDPAAFLAVAIILRDRYLSYMIIGEARGSTLVGFLSMAILFISALFIIATTGAAVYDSAYTSLLEEEITRKEFHRKVTLADRFQYAYVGLEIGLMMLLVWFTIVVRRWARSDKIMKSVTFAIMPLMILYTTVRVIFEILDVLLTEKASFSSHNADQFEFVSNFLFHFLFFVTMSVICRLYLRPTLWLEPRRNLRSSRREAYNLRYRGTN